MKYDSEMYARPALVSSKDLAWPGLRVERHQLDSIELPAHYHEQHLLLLHQGVAPVTSRRQQGSRVEEAVFRAGDAGLYPGGEYGAIVCSGPTDTIHLYLDNQYLENLARQGMDLTHFGLRDRYKFEDALLSELGRQLLGAVGAHHTLGQLYVEMLTNALCGQLIEHHATYERRVAAGPQLPSSVLARLEAYLEAHADAPVTLETMAGLANLSVFHFARRFKQTTGASPYQYVISWKIRRARQLLRAADAPIAAISDALGFASPAHFSAAFKRSVGQSPREFQRS
ncbi:helix-turn-helix transcriptional regulator [uncultured Hymenobacter sp.]|uniref:helix-turn-helix transcriptional regulator n=1 Tax=uncultured Hymenobacter sp. TaxID=170016 RepID=UPI0035CB7BCF